MKNTNKKSIIKQNTKKSLDQYPKSILFDKQIIKDIDDTTININNGDEDGDTGLVHGHIATHRLKKYIVSNMLQPLFITDINDAFIGRFRWQRVSMVMYIISLFFVHIATILTFISGYNNGSPLSMVAGSIGVCGTIFIQLSKMAKGESKKMTYRANSVLKELGIDKIVDIDTYTDKSPREKSDSINEIQNELDIINNPINKSRTVIFNRFNNNPHHIINIDEIEKHKDIDNTEFYKIDMDNIDNIDNIDNPNNIDNINKTDNIETQTDDIIIEDISNEIKLCG